MHKVGERVGAILGSKDKTVEFFGYGIYEGDFDPTNPPDSPKAVGAVADMGREASRIAKENNIPFAGLNPRIRLDNGKVVWGCECWWGNETAIKSKIAEMQRDGFTIVDVDIDEVRKPYQE